MAKRIALISMVAVLLLMAGYFSLRNVVADQLEPFYVAWSMDLSQRGVDQLERRLKFDPYNFADRIELLEYYSFKSIRGNLAPDELMNRRRHTLWVIQHEPASTVAGELAAAFNGDNMDVEGQQEGKDLWLQQVQARPTDVRALHNAGEFFSFIDDWKQAEELRERAYTAQPTNYDAASSLAVTYWRDARHSSTNDQRTSWAIKSLKAYEQALSDAHNPQQRLDILPDAAQAAYEAGEYDRAGAYANEAINLASQTEHASNSDDAVHYGNIVLGRIVTATADLLKSAAIKGNPHLDSFGPNMMLAKELLEKGQSKTVLEYFDQCSKFWSFDQGKLSQWRTAVLAGKAPDFGENLYY